MNIKSSACECGENCKCGKNCKCKGCLTHKKNDKDLLIGRLKEMIRELINQTLDEMTGTGAVAGYLTKNAFGHTADATASLPGFKKVGDINTNTLEEKSKKDKIVPVGKEKSPDVVKGPKSRGIKKDDVYILRKRKAIAASKKDNKDVDHYDSLIGLAKKHGVQ